MARAARAPRPPIRRSRCASGRSRCKWTRPASLRRQNGGASAWPGRARGGGPSGARAHGAVQELHQGVQLLGDVVNATAEVSRSQAQRLASLAQSLQQVAATSAASSESANGAAASTQAQITSMGDLTVTSQQLAQLAERLRSSIARFSVLSREHQTAERRADAAAD